MNALQPLSQLLRRLWRHVGPRRRRQLGLLFVLMLAASYAEVLTIGAVLPFLGVLTAPEVVFNHRLAQPLVRWLGIAGPEQLLLPLTVFFCAATLAASAMRLLILWANIRLSNAIGADLSISVYRRTLYQPYPVHVARNSSEVIDGIAGKTNGIVGATIMPLMTLASAAVMLVMVVVALLAIAPWLALAAAVGFGLVYGLAVRLTQRHLAANSQRIAHESTRVLKALQEGLGGIRDVLIDGTQATYCRIYRDADLPLRRAQGNNQFIAQCPRLGIEAIGMLLIAALAYVLARQEQGIAAAIPVLGALALGAQRLLPVLQQGYLGWSTMRGKQASLQEALDLLDQPLPADVDRPAAEPLDFRREIRLRKLGLRYTAEGPWVLRDLDLVIPKGGRIGFIGATGSGKSTLLDVVMALLPPTEGTVEVDDRPLDAAIVRSWQAQIAHVPQTVFLTDASIEENIAFGIPPERIDRERVRQAARLAQIAEVVESWPEKYGTLVGERGVRLSGGQRQRVGIARALYKRASVLVFDEATSALDNATERAVMESIEGLGEDVTILMVAHRLSTLRNCSQIVEVTNGAAESRGRFADLVGEAT